MAISTAVGLERISKVVGYQVKKGKYQDVSPNLPMRIAVLAEANQANQASLDTTAKEIISATQAGNLYGFGSPIHQIVRILIPLQGEGVGGIPVVVYPQAEAVEAVAAERSITVTGTVSKNATHAISINGRTGVDGQNYSFSVVTTDTVTTIATKITDAINAVIGSPVIATSAAGVVTLTAKWAGLTSEQLTVESNVFGNAVGLTYTIGDEATGVGSPSIAGALTQFGNDWNTIVVNSYDAATFADLETANGTPEDEFPTGKYSPIVFKPFVSMFGSVSSSASAITTITDAAARKTQVTHVLSPAPNSKGFTYEASANMAYLWALAGQNTPHLDVSGKSYPDMPVPEDGLIGDFASYDNRDLIVKAGGSTVDFVNGRYVVTDAVTTYHPVGEITPQWRYVRSLMQDWNVRYGFYILEAQNVTDKAIAGNDQVVNVSGVIKPKQWVQILNSYADDLSNRALIVEPDFMKASITVGTGDTNPDRLESAFRYKRSPFARISSTTAEAGFAFGLRG